jgi:parallel beta-helix repeat protein
MRVMARVVVACALAAFGLLAVGVSPASAGATLNVGPGQPYATIQAAVNAAKPGDLIVVMPGTYSESVVVNTSGLTIRGALNMPLPVLQSPGNDTGCNLVVGEDDGFCIFPPGPGTINNIEISRLQIQNFNANGVIAFAANGLNVHDIVAVDNADYGIARFVSSHTQIVNNVVTGNLTGEAGIYNGDSPNSSSLIRLNNVSGYPFGIFVRDSDHGTVSENTVTGNCFGMLFIDTGQPGDVSDWTVVHNTANNNTGACPGEEGPPTSGAGIVIAGVNHSRFTANTANGNAPSGASPFGSGGLVVLSSSSFGGQDPSYVQIDNNSLHGNSPVDIAWDGSGSFITFFKNSCSSSSPPGLCV